MPRWIENCTSKQSARLYHKFDNARGSDFARVMVVELDVTETMEEDLISIARARWQVESRTIETGYVFVHHGCSTYDVMKGQSK